MSHKGLDGLPPKERTFDRYWKAHIVEIRSPKRKINTTINAVRIENDWQELAHLTLFQEYYLRVKWFYSKNDIEQVKPNGIEGLDR